MKLIVGLGNPGRQYAATRHNVGFLVVDRLARPHGLSGAKTKFHAGVIEGVIAEQRVMLMQPTTYMNRSGLAVGEAAGFYKLEASDVMVVVDDTALPVGQIRLRAGGSSGGHNGLADIERALGTRQYPRLRVGVGEPRVGEHRIPQRDYVLSPFGEDQRRPIDDAIEQACDGVEIWLREGIDLAMTRSNARATEQDEE